MVNSNNKAFDCQIAREIDCQCCPFTLDSLLNYQAHRYLTLFSLFIFCQFLPNYFSSSLLNYYGYQNLQLQCWFTVIQNISSINLTTLFNFLLNSIDTNHFSKAVDEGAMIRYGCNGTREVSFKSKITCTNNIANRDQLWLQGVPKKRTFRMLLKPQCTGSIKSSRNPLCLAINWSFLIKTKPNQAFPSNVHGKI